jgi:hypothetical protein
MANDVWANPKNAVKPVHGAINELNQALGSIWHEVDMAGVLASQESFGTLNAGRKPAKYKV